MVKLKIKEIATARGIKTAYGLQKRTGFHPGHASRLWKGDLDMIGLSVIDRLCKELECVPGDLIVRVSEKTHPPRKARK